MAFLRYAAIIAACALLITACSRQDSGSPDDAATKTGETSDSAAVELERPAAAPVEIDPKQEFWAALAGLCGKSFPGNITVGTEESDREYFERPLLINTRDCSEDEIVIRFSFGDDTSLAWVLVRGNDGIALEHRTEGNTSTYGGLAEGAGSAQSQEFPADNKTAAARPLDAATAWYITMLPGEKFVYGFRNDERFRYFELVFDLTQAAESPDAAL